MPNRYEVRGPNGDRREAPGIPNDRRWDVWDREKDCPVLHFAARDMARDSARDLNEHGWEPGSDGQGDDELDQLPMIIDMLRGN